jgi:hypothetical protein
MKNWRATRQEFIGSGLLKKQPRKEEAGATRRTTKETSECIAPAPVCPHAAQRPKPNRIRAATVAVNFWAFDGFGG